MQKFLVICALALSLCGCELLETAERVEDLEDRAAALRSEIVTLKEGEARETALAKLADLELELADVEKTLWPANAAIKLAGFVLALVVGGAGAYKVRSYAQVAELLVRKFTEAIPRKIDRKALIQPAALDAGVEGTLNKIVKKVG